MSCISNPVGVLSVSGEEGFAMSTQSVSPFVAAAGGSFLLETRTPAEIFTPEDLDEEQRQIAATAARFAREEIEPNVAAIEAKEPGVMAGLLRKAAELGFTSVEIPEEYGGMGLDKVSSTLITDHVSILASFSTAFGAHSASRPCLWSGTAPTSKSSAICRSWRVASGSDRMPCPSRPQDPTP